MAHRIEIEHAKYTKKRQLWRVWFGDELLIEQCRYPLGDAARALLARGITGKLEMGHRPGANGLCQGLYPAPVRVCMTGDIEKLAGFTMNDGDTQLTVRRFVEAETAPAFGRRKPEKGEGGTPAGGERRSGFLGRLGIRLGAFQGRGDIPTRR